MLRNLALYLAGYVQTGYMQPNLQTPNQNIALLQIKPEWSALQTPHTHTKGEQHIGVDTHKPLVDLG